MSTTTYILWRNKKKISVLLGGKNALCGVVFSTINIKTIPLIRPLLGRTKGGLNSGILLYLQCRINVDVTSRRCMPAGSIHIRVIIPLPIF